jgi:hypothetical protein
LIPIYNWIIFILVKIDHFDEDLNEVEDINSNVEYDVGFTGSDFNETFYLDSLHFHWGEKAPNGVYTGSEHTIGHTLDGIQYPLEVNKKCKISLKAFFHCLSNYLN